MGGETSRALQKGRDSEGWGGGGRLHSPGHSLCLSPERTIGSSSVGSWIPENRKPLGLAFPCHIARALASSIVCFRESSPSFNVSVICSSLGGASLIAPAQIKLVMWSERILELGGPRTRSSSGTYWQYGLRELRLPFLRSLSCRGARVG